MKSLHATLMLFVSSLTLTIQSTINPCLYNREDTLECMDHSNSGVISPGPNQYTIHATRFQRGSNGLPICVIRKEGEIVEDIISLGTGGVKFLFSPGADRSPPQNYTNQILVEYNVQCPLGTSVFIDFESFDLEPKNCLDHRTNEHKCQDYVVIDSGADGSMEYCGNVLPGQFFTIGTENFTLTMRSGFDNSYPGFRAFVTCFTNEDSDTRSNTVCNNPEVPTSTQFEVTNLGASPNLHTRKTSLHVNQSTVNMTSKDIKIIRTIEKSLLEVALNVAGRRRSSINWPPTSYSENRTGDITNLKDLALLPSPSLLQDEQSPTLQPAGIRTARQRRKRRFTRNARASQVRLDSRTILMAIRNKDACNPIVRSTVRSYINIAQRMDPAQLREVQQNSQQKLS